MKTKSGGAGEQGSKLTPKEIAPAVQEVLRDVFQSAEDSRRDESAARGICRYSEQNEPDNFPS